MDEKEVLTRFKNGGLDRAQVAALMSGAADGDGVAGIAAGPEPVVFHLPDAWPERDADGPTPAAARSVTVTSSVSSASSVSGRDTVEPVAIVGMAGRYPGAPDLAAFWRRTCSGHGSASAPPAGRPGDETGHYLDRVQDFDPEFFGIDAHEAALMDPQERLFLETAWEALEDAGCTGGRLDALTAPDGTRRSVGVFAGAGSGDYALLAARTWTRERAVPMPRSGPWSLPNRLSALLGLTGPSQSVDTKQSSVLVAVHHALAALHRGECAAALVGGVRLLLHPSSRRPGAGEGVGALLLKPLERALADGDTVHCVVRGSAVGHTAPHPSSGATAGPGRGSRTVGVGTGGPAHGGAAECGSGDAGGSGDASAQRVLREALRAAGVDAAAVVREDAGSVRALVGDAGAATGAALLTRAVLQLRHRVLPPGADRAEAQSWQSGGNAENAGGAGSVPRRICVGLRGGGGAEAHVVLEEYVPAAAVTQGRAPSIAAGTEACVSGVSVVAGVEECLPAAGELFVLSAPTPAHLVATARRFVDLLGGHGVVPGLGVVARALRGGRAAMDCRFAAVVGDTGELVRTLEQFVRDGGPCSDLRDGDTDPLGLGGLPETDDYVAALWRAGHLRQLRALWLSGLDIDWAALERAHGSGAVAVSLPPSAFLRVPLWLGGEEGQA
ncbi:polyketide synthase [Streptomyces sp. NPDC005808]|uniref:beta-ketoacyl [acyl carrier protein] synthase domain-containing protein n=1 Tax=Streptomyces sp. NPDC005808 TaxID=3364734 RepID=UPI0036C36633